MDSTGDNPRKDQNINEAANLENGESNNDVYVFPTSFSQKRFWFLDQFDPGSPFYNIPTVVKISGDFDIEIFRRCLDEIGLRHETLRTTFSVMDGEPVQIISSQPELPITLIELDEFPVDNRSAEALRIAKIEARRPFDLKNGPLMRVTVIKIHDREHVVIMNMHHIVSDGWSMGILVAEISALYNSFAKGLESPLPELPIQYADFAEWQQNWLKGEVLEEQISYWQEQLSGEIPILELPTDNPRPSILSSKGGAYSIKIEQELINRLEELNKSESATMFMTLLTAFQVLLYRYTNLDDITVGSPVANRNRSEIEGLIGVFINTLVLRTDLSGNPKFHVLLARVRETTLGAYAHQDIPFEMLVDRLHSGRDMSHTPLFQVMFVLQNAPTTIRGQQSELNIEQIEVHMGTSTFDLTLMLSESTNGMDASVEYNADIFNEATIARFLGHYKNLLHSIVDHPDSHISDLRIIDPAEESLILIDWNKTLGKYPQDLCIHEFVENNAKSIPNSEALVLPESTGQSRRSLSYQELNEQANQFAHYLIGLGLRPGMLVGISIDRSVEMIVCILGVLKAGGAYVPLDPQYPMDRLEFMIKDSDLPILITQGDLLGDFPRRIRDAAENDELHIILIDEEINEINKRSTENPKTDIAPDYPAYVIYTSGSTGVPKGVMVPHGAVVNHNTASARMFKLTSDDRVFQFATINFDTAVEELFPSFFVGSTVVLRPNYQIAPGKELHQLVEEEQITVLDPPTAYWHEWVRELSKTNEKIPVSIKLLIVGGEKALAEHLISWMNCGGSEATWLNTYGPTEATVIATSYVAPTDESWDNLTNIPIGKPITNTQCYIFDRYLYPVPIGVPGELCLGGVGIAYGYLNDPKLTAEKFIPDPYSEAAGSRLYKTGDIVRYLSDGNIEFIGRIDEQVKVRGFRVEPGEVEAILTGHPDVDEVVVVTDEASPGELRLVSYVVPESDAQVDIDDLRQYSITHLPEYMVPAMFILMKTLPLTPNGKIDRRALPKPDWSKRISSRDFVGPRSPLEKALVDIWKEVLGVENISVYDNFFELGGHSLLATQVISRVRGKLNIEIPLRKLFESPDIASISKLIEYMGSGVEGLSAPSIPPLPRDPDRGIPLEPPQLSFAQQRLWFLDQLDPGVAYNLPEAVRIRGNLDEQVLESCLNDVVRRHETLRTTFTVIEGVPVQQITPAHEIIKGHRLYLDIEIDDLHHLEESEREQRGRQIAQLEAQDPFDLLNGPLIRARLVRLTAETDSSGSREEGIFLLTMHHIVGDNWSSNILIQEIATLYNAYLSGKPSPLPSLFLQYADFSSWQRNWLSGNRLKNELTYWKDKLEGLPPLLEIQTDRPRPPVQTVSGDYLTFSLSEELSNKIGKLSMEVGVTTFMLLLAAFQAFLSRYSGQNDIAVGTPIANRNREEVEKLIGFFVNTLVLRASFDNDPTFIELVQQVQDTAIEAYAHQDVPFEMIVDEIQPERNMSHSPLFQVMFAMQTSQRGTNALPDADLSLTPMDIHSGTSKFDLTLFMAESGEPAKTEASYILNGAIEYNTDLFNKSTIERMIMHFEVLLANLVSNPDQRVSEAPLITAEEFHTSIVDWNDTYSPLPAITGVHQLFEQQAKLFPRRTAVRLADVDKEERFEHQFSHLSYDELNQRANILAHYLIRRGIGPEKLVGLFMERSIDLIVCILGVLKAGGAYLPLDPIYPADRLGFMLRDSGIHLIITQTRLRDLLPNADDLEEQGCCQQILIDQDWECILAESEKFPGNLQDPNTSVGLENLAYVIYTSGSTGKPKGTMINHLGLINYLTWVKSAYPIDQGQGAPVHSSISFDLTITGLFGPLVVGKSVVMLLEGLDVDNLSRVIKEQSKLQNEPFGLIKITPAHLRLLADQLAPTDIVKRVNSFIIGGENLLADHISFWQKHSPDTILVNEYGPTETVVGCCVYFIPHNTGDEDLKAPVIPIGRPIINTRLFILDKKYNPVPIGVVGELFIGGKGVSRGYLSRPEITAERFIPDPFSGYFQNSGENGLGGRLYRTGDLARFLPNGDIECLGRLDFQVKLRGFRVELGEVEAVLNDHPEVAESAAWVWKNEGDERLVVYVVPERVLYDRDSKQEVIQTIREYLVGQVPAYMVPSHIVLLEEIPLTPNGKVNYDSLPEPVLTRLSSDAVFVAPRNPLEEILVNVWRSVLTIRRESSHTKISVFDNFFEIGGHSLLATQVTARINDALGLTIPLRAIFEEPTIAGLAEWINRTEREGTSLVLTPIEKLPRDQNTGIPVEFPPLSYAQKRLWIIEQLEPGTPLYNTPATFQINGDLDLPLLERSLNILISRHESLRTTFAIENEEPVQVIAPQLVIPFQTHDISQLSANEQLQTQFEIIRSSVIKPFDLERGPLLRVDIICKSTRENIIILNMHHIITDDWSLGIFVREMGLIYNDLLSNGTEEIGSSLFPELTIQYSDYSAWQRKWLQGEVLDTQLDYWREQLSGLPPLLDLTTDRPRPALQTYRGGQVTFNLSDELTEGLYDLCRESSATIFMVLLAAFQTLLFRYSGSVDFAVGTPIANRSRVELDNLIGFFINTLVMRADLSGDPSFMDLVERTRNVALGAYSNQDIPFEMLVDELAVSRDMSYSPLFQVMMVLQNAPRGFIEIASDLRVVPLEVHDQIARFDLTMSIVEMDEYISGAIEFNSDLFDLQTIERLVNNFIVMINSILTDPNKNISALHILDKNEIDKLQYDWNATTKDLRPPHLVHQRFEQQVEKNPDNIALIFGEQRVTYDELNRKSNRLARYLLNSGASPEDILGVCVDRSLDMIVAILGVIKAGCAYLPIDPSYPDERIAYMAYDSGARIILTQQLLHERIQKFANSAQVINLDTERAQIDLNSDENPDIQYYPENLAYVIYTSGSTGKPKGTMLHHRGLINFCQDQQVRLGINPDNTMLQFAGFSFDASVSEIFTALLNGASLCLAMRETLLSEPDLLQLIRNNRVTHAILPPSLLSILPAAEIPDLTTVVSAGEACTADIVNRWATDRHFFNGYGPTEATIGPSLFEVLDPLNVGLNVPIGKPIDNVQIYVLDQSENIVPIGVSGEIYIGGVGVARGYLDRPELTAAVFLPDPFNPEPGSRMYKTGDVAKFLPDGNLVFIGRADNQVKVRGFRVELGEIESVVMSNKEIRECVVINRESAAGLNQLHAFITSDKKEKISVNDIRTYLQDRLPDYMVPAYFTQLDELPLTPNGKIDRLALAAEEIVEMDRDDKFIEPQTNNELILADIWQELLKIKKIGTADNFFNLGGDSILAIQMITRANQAGIHITPRQLFQSPTIHGILTSPHESIPAVTAEQGIVVGNVPLTPVQKWFFDQHKVKPDHWNTSMFLEIMQEMDVELLRETANRLSMHHDALRMRFSKSNRLWDQVNEPYKEEDYVVVIDLSGIPKRKRRKAIEQNAEEIQRSLNLSQGPLMKIAYFDPGQGENKRLLLVVHHLVFDAVSWQIIIEDFQRIYQQLVEGTQISLPPKTSSYKEWSGRLLDYAQSDQISDELEYWTNLAGVDITHVPADFPSGENTFGSMVNETRSLTIEETNLLLRGSYPVFRSQIRDLLLTALVKAVGKMKGTPELLIEIASHGREDIFSDLDVSRTIGWFSNNYPIYFSLEGVSGLKQEIFTIRDQLANVPGNGIGFGLLKYLSKNQEVNNKIQKLPSPTMFFNYLGQFGQSNSEDWVPFRIAKESPGAEQDPQEIRSTLLHAVTIITGGRLQIRWVYSENLYKRRKISKFASTYINELKLIANHISID